MQKRIDLLENTLLELGSEIHRLKAAVGKVNERNHAMSKLFGNLKGMLHEKNVMSELEFETYEESLELEEMVQAIEDMEYDDESYNLDDHH